MEPFSSQSEHRDPSKKTRNFRLSPKRVKSGIRAPQVPKRCPKGSILEVFLLPFQGPMPKVKTVLSLESQPHLEGSRVPENHQFSMFFSGSASSTIPEGTLGSTFPDFYRFLRILGIEAIEEKYQKILKRTSECRMYLLHHVVCGCLLAD